MKSQGLEKKLQKKKKAELKTIESVILCLHFVTLTGEPTKTISLGPAYSEKLCHGCKLA